MITLQVVATTLTFVEKMKAMAIDFTPRLIGAVAIYFIGSWIVRLVLNGLKSVLMKKNYDASLQTFIMSLINILLRLILLVTVVNMLGVDTTSFAALLAGAGLAIGSALNGTLGNFAGGVMMLIFKPFKVGDIIEAQGQVGVVKEMGVFNTVLLTPENKTVILPNGPLSTGVITNFNTHGNLRVDLTMAIAPDESIEKARKVALETMAAFPGVLSTPAPEVSVLKVGDGMVTLAVRPYTTQGSYWSVYFGVTEAVKLAFDKNGVAGPVPHRVVINKGGGED